jgi:hypothetical protein
MTIRVLQDGVERELTYDEFVREVRVGRIVGSTLVLGDVLTSGVWKPAIELQFFRSWAPAGSIPVSTPFAPATAPPPEVTPAGDQAPEPSARADEDESPLSPWRPEEGPITPRWERAYSDASAVPGPRTAADGEKLPWERQDEIGFARGLYGTIRLAFDNGVEYARRIAAGEVIMPSLVFGIVITAITAIFEAGYAIGALHLAKGLLDQMESQLPEIFGQAGPPTVRDIVFLEGMRILFYPLTMFVWAGFIHLLLRLFSRPDRPFAATFRVASYAIAPMILNVLPGCGVLIGIVWVGVLTIRGLKVVQKTSTFASILAVLLPAIGYLIWMTVANQGLMRSLPHLGGTG